MRDEERVERDSEIHEVIEGWMLRDVGNTAGDVMLAVDEVLEVIKKYESNVQSNEEGDCGCQEEETETGTQE